jgi:hypothetical protein
MSSQGRASGSERSPLLPKAVIEHHEQAPGGEVSDKPEKSQAMVMYVFYLPGFARLVS